MSTIVSNTGPLIALVGIHKVELLRELFGVVQVADAVKREVLSGGAGAVGSAIFQQHTWIKSVALGAPADPLLATVLDAGEAATIALALEKGAELVLMDEAKGRKIAREVYRLNVVGTGRVLIESKKHGLISSVLPLLEQLRSNGYWLSDKIVSAILAEAGE